MPLGGATSLPNNITFNIGRLVRSRLYIEVILRFGLIADKVRLSVSNLLQLVRLFWNLGDVHEIISWVTEVEILLCIPYLEIVHERLDHIFRNVGVHQLVVRVELWHRNPYLPAGLLVDLPLLLRLGACLV